MSTITQRVRSVAAALSLGFALAGIFVGAALAASNVPAGYTAQQWRAEQLRSRALNQKYHPGASRNAGTSAPQAWLRGLMIRSDALDRKYRLGRYAVARAIPQRSSGFDWGDAGIGSAATFGLILAALGLATSVRRYRAGDRTSASPSPMAHDSRP